MPVSALTGMIGRLSARRGVLFIRKMRKERKINMRRLDIETVSAEELRQDIAVEENEENGTLTLAEQAGDILEGILAAAENLAGETQEITISRNGKKYFKL